MVFCLLLGYCPGLLFVAAVAIVTGGGMLFKGALGDVALGSTSVVPNGTVSHSNGGCTSVGEFII